MAYWVFVVTAHKIDGDSYLPEDILAQRFRDLFWGLGERTPNRRFLKKGDEVVFYAGTPHQGFVASATLASDSFRLNDSQKHQYGHGKEFFTADNGVLLNNPQTWSETVSVADIVAGLEFIENKENWYAYFQGGVRQLTEHDYRLVIQGREIPLSERVRSEQDIEDETEFALEAHLEEFIDKNWDRINFGAKLARYAVEDQDGRQFAAGPWSIDFLCTDTDNGDFVVVELKRGKSSDATVGQVLRYMGWVRENLAEQGQRVRGVIITQDTDEALRYAVMDLPLVSVLTYKVDFKLRPSS